MFNKIMQLVLASLVVFNCVACSLNEKYVRSTVVILKSSHGSCTGNVVKAPSGKLYILSAAHCSVLAENNSIPVALDDERLVPARILEVSPTSDLMLLEAPATAKNFLVPADSVKFNEDAYSFGHGGGRPTQRGFGETLDNVEIEVMDHEIKTPEDEASCNKPKNKIEEYTFFFMTEKVCVIKETVLVSTVPIIPGNSGGALINTKGSLIGVASASGEGFSFWATLADIKLFLAAY